VRNDVWNFTLARLVSTKYLTFSLTTLEGTTRAHILLFFSALETSCHHEHGGDLYCSALKDQDSFFDL